MRTTGPTRGVPGDPVHDREGFYTAHSQKPFAIMENAARMGGSPGRAWSLSDGRGQMRAAARRKVASNHIRDTRHTENTPYFGMLT